MSSKKQRWILSIDRLLKNFFINTTFYNDKIFYNSGHTKFIHAKAFTRLLLKKKDAQDNTLKKGNETRSRNLNILKCIPPVLKSPIIILLISCPDYCNSLLPVGSLTYEYFKITSILKPNKLISIIYIQLHIEFDSYQNVFFNISINLN